MLHLGSNIAPLAASVYISNEFLLHMCTLATYTCMPHVHLLGYLIRDLRNVCHMCTYLHATNCEVAMRSGHVELMFIMGVVRLIGLAC